jgi:hypothetical protein
MEAADEGNDMKRLLQHLLREVKQLKQDRERDRQDWAEMDHPAKRQRREGESDLEKQLRRSVGKHMREVLLLGDPNEAGEDDEDDQDADDEVAPPGYNPEETAVSPHNLKVERRATEAIRKKMVTKEGGKLLVDETTFLRLAHQAFLNCAKARRARKRESPAAAAVRKQRGRANSSRQRFAYRCRNGWKTCCHMLNKSDADREKGLTLLKTSFMPEIVHNADGTVSHYALPWWSDEARGIIKAASEDVLKRPYPDSKPVRPASANDDHEVAARLRKAPASAPPWAVNDDAEDEGDEGDEDGMDERG